MIERIVSGGQTGVDRAALDAAIAAALPCGGWCPRGRLAEDGAIDAAYPLTETAGSGYGERTRANVRGSDATLVIAAGPVRGGTAETVSCAGQAGKPLLAVDLDSGADDRGRIAEILAWITAGNVRTLNVAGPRESEAPGVYARARALLAALIAADQDRRAGGSCG